LLGYVGNRPTGAIDPFGLCSEEPDEQGRPRIRPFWTTTDEEKKAEFRRQIASGELTVTEAGMPDYRAMLAKIAETAYKNLSPAQMQALREAMEGAGKRIMEGKIKDLARPENLWAKMQHVTRNADGTPSAVVHYWMNLQTKIGEVFKFK
jgi:hypothetical protein